MTLRVMQNGSRYHVIAEVHARIGTLVAGRFSLDGGHLNSDSNTVDGRGFAELRSDRVDDASPSDVFKVAITSQREGVVACTVSVGMGINTCR